MLLSVHTRLAKALIDCTSIAKWQIGISSQILGTGGTGSSGLNLR
jgi:hypothetical protein